MSRIRLERPHRRNSLYTCQPCNGVASYRVCHWDAYLLVIRSIMGPHYGLLPSVFLS